MTKNYDSVENKCNGMMDSQGNMINNFQTCLFFLLFHAIHLAVKMSLCILGIAYL